MQNITHITQVTGLGFISPRPRARLETTIARDALAAPKKEQKQSKAGQNTQKTSYIIYIMNNLNTQSKTLKNTHSK